MKKNISTPAVVNSNEVVTACTVMSDDVIREHPDEHIGNRCGVFLDDRGIDGYIFVNEQKGWRLDHTIYFDFAHNAYIKSRLSLKQVTDMIGKEFGLSTDDSSDEANSLRYEIAGSIKHYDELLEDSEYFPELDDIGNPDVLNLELSTLLGDALTVGDSIVSLEHLASARAELQE